MTALPTDIWGLIGTIVEHAPAIIAAVGVFFTIWQNRNLQLDQTKLRHQVNSLTDARVAVASQAGHAEGMLAGAAGEQERVARMIAATVAIEVARLLAEKNKIAIEVKPTGAST